MQRQNTLICVDYLSRFPPRLRVKICIEWLVLAIAPLAGKVVLSDPKGDGIPGPIRLLRARLLARPGGMCLVVFAILIFSVSNSGGKVKRRDFLTAAGASVVLAAGANKSHASEQLCQSGRTVISLDELIVRIPADAIPKSEDDSLQPVIQALNGEAWAKSPMAIRDRFIAYPPSPGLNRFRSSPKSIGALTVTFVLYADMAVRDGRYLNRLDVMAGDEVEVYASNLLRGRPGPGFYLFAGKPVITLSVSDTVVQLARISKERFDREQKLKPTGERR
jgi:hypothetical protein